MCKVSSSRLLFLLQLLEKDRMDDIDDLRIDGGTGSSVHTVDPVGVGASSPILFSIYIIILLKSVCRCSITAGRNSCSIVSGNVSNCSYRLSVLPLTS